MRCSCFFAIFFLRYIVRWGAALPRFLSDLGPSRKRAVLFPRLRYFGGVCNVEATTTITVTQQVPVTVAFTDKKGNPAKVDGTPTWATDNSDVLSLTPAADGLSCVVAAVGMIGTGTVQVSADSDLGVGVVPVIAGTATIVTLTPGTPSSRDS